MALLGSSAHSLGTAAVDHGSRPKYDAGERSGGGRGVEKKWENWKICRNDKWEARRTSPNMLSDQDMEMEGRGLKNEAGDLEDWRTPM